MDITGLGWVHYWNHPIQYLLYYADTVFKIAHFNGARKVYLNISRREAGM